MVPPELERPLPADLDGLLQVQVAVATGQLNALPDGVAKAREAGGTRERCAECLLQAVLFCGFPRVITAWHLFTEAWPGPPLSGGGLPPDEQAQAGQELFSRIYGKNTEPVQQMLTGFHQELRDFVLESAYGRILTRPGMSPMEREILAVAALAAMEQKPQLIAHGRGARRFGATASALRMALDRGLPERPGPQGQPRGQWLEHLLEAIERGV